jgi:hypothetical protein
MRDFGWTLLALDFEWKRRGSGGIRLVGSFAGSAAGIV